MLTKLDNSTIDLAAGWLADGPSAAIHAGPVAGGPTAHARANGRTLADDPPEAAAAAGLRRVARGLSARRMQRAGAQRGELVARVLLSSGAPIGWYVYYLGRDRMAQVVQIAAAERHVAALLDHLAADADRRGAIAIEGRLEAGLVEPLSDRHAWIAYREPLALIHSRSPEITAAIHAGQSFLTRADGEWPAVFNL